MPNPCYFPDSDITSLVAQIEALPRQEDEIVLLFMGEHSNIAIDALLPALKERNIPIVGGIFPGLIYGDQRYETGVVADVLPVVAQPCVIHGLDNSNIRLDDLPLLSKSQYTALVLVDGLSKYIAVFLDRLFRRMGNSVRYIGGGAGSLSFQQKPCVFDSVGIYQDAALLIWVGATTEIGVRHGWHHLHGPLIASRTEGTVVQQLNNQSALRVYRQIVEKKSGQTLTKENFFSIAKEYPLGIYNKGLDYIVRDPLTFTDDGSLVCVGEVPKGAMIYILQGNKESLINHAKMATSEAILDAPIGQHLLIVDCISRVLYLEDDFNQELDAVIAALPENSPTPYGILSLGEIATFKTGRVEFFNKTFVVGSLSHSLSL